MKNEDMLARLLAQAASDGNDLVTLRAIVEEASELGARRMLERVGLDDESAIHDVSELRELLQAWRDAKASAWKGLDFTGQSGSTLGFLDIAGGGSSAWNSVTEGAGVTVRQGSVSSSVLIDAATTTITGSAYAMAFGNGNTIAVKCVGNAWIPVGDALTDHCK